MKYSIIEVYATLEKICAETGCKISLHHSDEILSFDPQYSAEGDYEDIDIEYKRYAGEKSLTLRGTIDFDESGQLKIYWYYRETPQNAGERGTFESPVDMTSKIWGVNLGDFMKAVAAVNNQLFWQQKKLEKLMKIYDRFADAEESED